LPAQKKSNRMKVKQLVYLKKHWIVFWRNCASHSLRTCRLEYTQL